MPVVEHDVHESVSHAASKPYGCMNRPEFRNGYFVMTSDYSDYRTYGWRIEMVKHTMSTECRFDQSLTDPKCEGCKHRGSGEAYDKSIREKGLK